MTTELITDDALLEASVRVIRSGQHEAGSYIASPNFAEYSFGWLRDGAYCAMAMDSRGERESAIAFHGWVSDVLEAQAGRIHRLVESLEAGEPAESLHLLPTRYELDGSPEPESDDEWPNFQLDGYGTWLYALGRLFSHEVPARFLPAVELASGYLAASWRLPCFDYWEESGDRQHTSTLAAIAAGLRSAARILERPALDATADDVLRFMVERCTRDGSFVKGPEDGRVDASLLSIAVPFGLLPLTDPLIVRTVERIREELLSQSGGVRRYLGDVYYGGNPWLLLTAWLGWYERLVGDTDSYRAARDWVAGHAGPDLDMPEQILDEPQAADFVAPWVERWGPVADPLLWSHAKYLLMESGAGASEWN